VRDLKIFRGHYTPFDWARKLGVENEIPLQ